MPCYAALLDQTVDVPGIGEVTLDVGYGGAFFAIVDARRFGFDIVASEARQLVEVGEAIKAAADEQLDVIHPENPEFNKIVFTEFTLPLEDVDGELTGRNTVVISPGKLDRSPCGTGTCARMAVMHAKAELGVGDGFVSRSVISSRFDGRIESETTLSDGTRAILPSIRGRALDQRLPQLRPRPARPLAGRLHSVGHVVPVARLISSAARICENPASKRSSGFGRRSRSLI